MEALNNINQAPSDEVTETASRVDDALADGVYSIPRPQLRGHRCSGDTHAGAGAVTIENELPRWDNQLIPVLEAGGAVPAVRYTNVNRSDECTLSWNTTGRFDADRTGVNKDIVAVAGVSGIGSNLSVVSKWIRPPCRLPTGKPGETNRTQPTTEGLA